MTEAALSPHPDMQALVALLQLPQADHSRRILLTASPSDWQSVSLPDWEIWDLGAGRRWEATDTRTDREQLNQICSRLELLGWPRECLKPEWTWTYNGFKKMMDLVLNHPTKHNPLILFGLVSEIDPLQPDLGIVEHDLQDIAIEFGCPHVCITDGYYSVIYSQANHSFNIAWADAEDVRSGLPRPEDFDLPAQKPFPEPVVISSSQMLKERLQALSAAQMMLDLSLLTPARASWLPEQKLAIQALRQAPSMLDIALVMLSGHAQAVSLLLPRTLLASGSGKAMRQFLLEGFCLRAWAELPEIACFNLAAPLALSLFYLGPKEEAQTTVLVEPILKADLTEISQSSGVKALQNKLEQQDFEPSASGLIWDPQAESPWLLSQLLPDGRLFPPGFLERGQVVTLGELCQIRVGIHKTKPADSAIHPQALNQGMLCVKGRDLTQPELVTEFLERVVPSGQSNVDELQLGDVLIPVIARQPGQHLHIVETDEAMTYSDTVLRLRLLPQAVETHPNLDPDYLKAYLQSEPVMRYLAARSQGEASVIRLLPSEMARLPVVILPLEPGLLAQLRDQHRRVRHMADRLQQMPAQLFNTADPELMGAELHQLKATGQLMLQSAEDIQKVSFQVCHYFPFALAYTYRQLMSLRDIRELYKEQLRLVENILAFLVSLCLAMLRSQGLLMQLGASLLAKYRKGISPGHWRDIIQDSLSLLMACELPPRLAQELYRLRLEKQQSGAGGILNQLIKAKNDFKHDRGPRTDDEYAQASRRATEQLDILLGSLNFLKDFPIWQLESLNRLRYAEAFELRGRVHMGDHPALFQESSQSTRAFCEEDMLLQLGPFEFIELHPFIFTRACLQCNRPEVFFIDQLSSKHIGIKSFEHGHSETPSDLMPEHRFLLRQLTPGIEGNDLSWESSQQSQSSE